MRKEDREEDEAGRSCPHLEAVEEEKPSQGPGTWLDALLCMDLQPGLSQALPTHLVGKGELSEFIVPSLHRMFTLV